MSLPRLALCALVLSLGCGDDRGPGSADASSSADAGSDGGGVDRDGGGTDGAAPPGDAGGPDATLDATVDAAVDAGAPISMPCEPVGACDPFEPSPCPAGQACRIGAMGLACYPVDAAPRAEGEACTAPAQCEPGTMCLDFGGGFACTRLCAEGSIGECGEGGACSGTIGDACVQACRPIPAPCDIYAQDCADPAQTCTLTRHPETTLPYTGCRPAGPRAEGETCGGSDGTCGHDLICIRIGDVTSCRQPCDPDDPAETCPAGQACTGTARTWMVGHCAPATP